ncbi:hypothetical protein KORDIASMS9_02315 [Kordia sp. SMS9]|uniref:hypothetical protein n=1 Tax=Kordia sp. SMS9 TaxID=2282170 RepID=UPI000E0DA9A7|nr:hypothetical protein [Kordia sp. SMS9]AXG70086.1 hypothetical protein KORDIASMS9_02315 [Kordia sp. SMS9]
MKIKSNALKDEHNSPFYKENKKICQEFENFIATKNGLVKGNFNAWSYNIYGKIKTPKAWSLQYKRSVYSGSISIWFSSKSQNLLTLAKWTLKDIRLKNTLFFIRRKKMLDSMRPSYVTLDNYSGYVLKTDGAQLKFFMELLDVLQSLFASKEIYIIKVENELLTIELRSEKLHLHILEKLLRL